MSAEERNKILNDLYFQHRETCPKCSKVDMFLTCEEIQEALIAKLEELTSK